MAYIQPSGEHTHTTGREPKHALGTTITFRPEHRHGSPRGYNSVTPKMFELLLLQHQSQLGVYAKSKECQPGVDPYSRLKYQLFLETQAAILKAFQSSGPKWYSGGHPGPDSSTFRAQLTFIVVQTPRTHLGNLSTDSNQRQRAIRTKSNTRIGIVQLR